MLNSKCIKCSILTRKELFCLERNPLTTRRATSIKRTPASTRNLQLLRPNLSQVFSSNRPGREVARPKYTLNRLVRLFSAGLFKKELNASLVKVTRNTTSLSTMAEGLAVATGSMLISTNQPSKSLENLKFDNKVLTALPYDDSTDPRVRREVPRACFAKAQPTAVENPETIVYSKSALALLDLPESEAVKEDFAEYFSGNKLLTGSHPAAHCYCGHQFGYFSGQLGDGAAM